MLCIGGNSTIITSILVQVRVKGRNAKRHFGDSRCRCDFKYNVSVGKISFFKIDKCFIDFLNDLIFIRGHNFKVCAIFSYILMV